jgi:hypothetical protein
MRVVAPVSWENRVFLLHGKVFFPPVCRHPEFHFITKAANYKVRITVSV